MYTFMLLFIYAYIAWHIRFIVIVRLLAALVYVFVYNKLRAVNFNSDRMVYIAQYFWCGLSLAIYIFISVHFDIDGV